jgi:hypothetical protein
MIYIDQLYLIICTLFLAGKDADSYQLKEKQDNALSATRVKRWHRDGLILAFLYVLPLVVWQPANAWRIVIATILIRLVFFDLPFNHWADLAVTYLGGTAWADKIFVRIFGINGAIKKTITFLILWIGANLLNHFI